MQTTTETPAYKVYEFLEELSKQTGRFMYNVTLVPWTDEARGGFLDFDMIFLNGKPYHFRFAVDNYKKRRTGESKLSRPSSVISEMADKMRHIKNAYDEAYIDMWYAIDTDNKTMFIPDGRFTVNTIKKYQDEFDILVKFLSDFKITKTGYGILHKGE